MSDTIDVYEGPYIGFDLSHGYHLEGYTIRKLSSGDFEIYVQEGCQVTGGAYTTGLYKEKMEGKSFPEVVEMLPLSDVLREELLNDKALKRFLGFEENERPER